MCFSSPKKPKPKSSELFAGEMGDQLTKFIKTPVLDDVLKESLALGDKDIYQRTKNTMISDMHQGMAGRNPALGFLGAQGNSSSYSDADSTLELLGNTLHGAKPLAQNFSQSQKMATLDAALGGAGVAAQNFQGISDRQSSINLTKYDQKNKNNLHMMDMAGQLAGSAMKKGAGMSQMQKTAQNQWNLQGRKPMAGGLGAAPSNDFWDYSFGDPNTYQFPTFGKK